ncbi:oxidoreductase [Actinoallomurus sp. NPDC050550]|uniref:oxidoreductase n=1 Tax=Actinoallomurus sp. NPDC050550 TaxID=3154937 RepID=UPI0033CDD443
MTWLPIPAVTVPVLLGGLAVVDGAFAGFRAATGRNARIHKRDYALAAARRGAAVSVPGLAATAVVSLTGAAGEGHWYGDLVEAGTRMLAVVAPYAAVVILSLAAYWLLPMRESTFVILVGLGPLTLARPAVVAAAVAAAGLGARDWLIWTAAVTAAAGVLVVEPWVHRRWYREPL